MSILIFVVLHARAFLRGMSKTLAHSYNDHVLENFVKTLGELLFQNEFQPFVYDSNQRCILCQVLAHMFLI